MTYYELWLDAVKKLDHNEITLGEYEKMIAPLHREVDTLDKIRAEIASYGTNSGMLLALEIIDKYKTERGSENDNL